MTVKYFVTFTTENFALAVAAISAKLKAILLQKSAKFYHFCTVLLILRTTANSVHAGQFCAKFCMRRILTCLVNVTVVITD